jgi:peptidoglycan hydrolase-like protein with peptidoglycan-binding domain
MEIKLLQTFLSTKGLLNDSVTGFFGDKTVSAVKLYQRSKGLPETGMVYDFTRESITAETCN